MENAHEASTSNDGDHGFPGSNEAKFYGVIPKTWCEHLEGNIKTVPNGGIDAMAKCCACGDERENWICLHCYEVCCSRYVNGHMKDHQEEKQHKIALSLADLSVWCFECDCYIHNALAQPAKEAAYRSKFGDDSLDETDLQPER